MKNGLILGIACALAAFGFLAGRFAARGSADEELRAEVARLESLIADMQPKARSKPEKKQVPAPKPAGWAPRYEMSGLVIAMSRDYGFLIATIEVRDPRDPIRKEYEFDVMRGPKLITRGRVVKVVEDPEKVRVPKVQIRVTHGRIADVRLGDSVVAVREAAPQRREVGDVARITGVIGGQGMIFALDRGRRHGLRERDTVFVYRDDALISVLRLELVDPEESIGRVVPGSRIQEPVLGDVVEFGKVGLERREIIGRIAHADREIVLDVGTKHGARPGQKFEVRRYGKRIGSVTVSDARPDLSIAEPTEGTVMSDLKQGDVVELVAD